MALVLGPGAVQKLHSRKAQWKAPLWEEVVQCSREKPLLISAAGGIAVKQIKSMNTPGRKRGILLFLSLLTSHCLEKFPVLLQHHHCLQLMCTSICSTTAKEGSVSVCLSVCSSEVQPDEGQPKGCLFSSLASLSSLQSN